jgi:dihydropteroate synthase
VDADWLDRRTSQGPTALRSRVQEYVQASGGATLPEKLSAAAQAALTYVLSHTGDRSVALDLLAADALITLALLAQAEHAPEGLEEFAGSVLRATRALA